MPGHGGKAIHWPSQGQGTLWSLCPTVQNCPWVFMTWTLWTPAHRWVALQSCEAPVRMCLLSLTWLQKSRVVNTLQKVQLSLHLVPTGVLQPPYIVCHCLIPCPAPKKGVVHTHTHVPPVPSLPLAHISNSHTTRRKKKTRNCGAERHRGWAGGKLPPGQGGVSSLAGRDPWGAGTAHGTKRDKRAGGTGDTEHLCPCSSPCPCPYPCPTLVPLSAPAPVPAPPFPCSARAAEHQDSSVCV